MLLVVKEVITLQYTLLVNISIGIDIKKKLYLVQRLVHVVFVIRNNFHAELLLCSDVLHPNCSGELSTSKNINYSILSRYDLVLSQV